MTDKLKEDIRTIGDIQLLVNSFYAEVRNNELLGPIFNGVIGERWPQHLEKMYRFWQTVLLEEHTYSGSPFPPHTKLSIVKDHFDTWLKLWYETINTHFEGEKANDAKDRGSRMAALFLSKLAYYRNNSGISLA